jgi:hypothetical protein
MNLTLFQGEMKNLNKNGEVYNRPIQKHVKKNPQIFEGFFINGV